MHEVKKQVKSGKYTIDRFEGQLAVLLWREDESVELLLDKKELPPEAEEGDILELQFSSEQLTSAVILKEETAAARKKAQDLL